MRQAFLQVIFTLFFVLKGLGFDFNKFKDQINDLSKILNTDSFQQLQREIEIQATEMLIQHSIENILDNLGKSINLPQQQQQMAQKAADQLMFHLFKEYEDLDTQQQDYLNQMIKKIILNNPSSISKDFNQKTIIEALQNQENIKNLSKLLTDRLLNHFKSFDITKQEELLNQKLIFVRKNLQKVEQFMSNELNITQDQISKKFEDYLTKTANPDLVVKKLFQNPEFLVNLKKVAQDYKSSNPNADYKDFLKLIEKNDQLIDVILSGFTEQDSDMKDVYSEIFQKIKDSKNQNSTSPAINSNLEEQIKNILDPPNDNNLTAKEQDQKDKSNSGTITFIILSIIFLAIIAFFLVRYYRRQKIIKYQDFSSNESTNNNQKISIPSGQIDSQQQQNNEQKGGIAKFFKKQQKSNNEYQNFNKVEEIAQN